MSGTTTTLETRERRGARARPGRGAAGAGRPRAGARRRWPRISAGVEPAAVTGRAALARLPVLRKSALVEAQAAAPPFGGFAAPPAGCAQVFQSPGRSTSRRAAARDWWRIGRFLHACGVGPGDVVQNCFSYHLTPAGIDVRERRAAVGATVLPAGTGQTELQVRGGARRRRDGYAGTPDFLKVILDAADAAGGAARLRARRTVSGGALFPSLRQEYAERGIACRQCYATADLGPDRLRERRRRGDDRRRGRGRRDRAAGHRRPGAGRRGRRGGGDDAQPATIR